MSDENQIPENSPEPGSSETTQGNHVPQEQVNKIVGDRLAREKQKYETQIQELQQKVEQLSNPPSEKDQGKKKQAKKDEEPDQLAELKQEVENMKREKVFLENTAGLGLSKEQNQLLQKLFMHENPDNPGEWLQQQAAAFGVTQNSSEDKQEMNNQNNGNRDSASDAGAPNYQARDPEGVQNPDDLTEDDIAYMYRKYGEAEGRKKLVQMVNDAYRVRKFPLDNVK